MPFGFGRKKDAAAGEQLPASDARGARSVGFNGFTDEWRLQGSVTIGGRLLDALNRREALPVENVLWAPAGGSAALEPAPGIQSMDPYDLVIVVAASDSIAAVGDEEREAHRVHKIPYDVALEVPPYRIVGTIRLHPGVEPESVMERSSVMFSAVTDPVVSLNGAQLDLGPDVEAILVNRFYVRGVTQVDKTTGEPHQRLPGLSMGGVSWREKT